MDNKEISRQLMDMAKEDQAIRKSLDFSDEVRIKMTTLDESNIKQLKLIIEQLGLPTISKVGKKASASAWLIAQHSPEQEFRKDYLRLMKQHLDDVDQKNLATMQDRVNMNDGKPQTYGTQFTQVKEGEFKLWKVHDQKNLDKRRAEIGMSSMSAEIKRISKNYRGKYKFFE
ncbi:MAG: hypothetical protein NTY66_01050 [Candidatus Vogelbacteria bacterium]|nr:hypothetical protein [Candidatus Vogelbacteria bacterium]